MAIQHSGAQVLSTYLISTGVVNAHTHPTWPCFYGTMPETPNNAVSIQNTEGIQDGRLMRTGHWVEHPGWQIRLRAQTEAIGMVKGLAIIEQLRQIQREILTLGGITYILEAVRKMTPIVPLGQEEGGARLLYTINGTITYGED